MSTNRKLPEKKEGLEDTCPLCDEKIHVGSKKSEGYPDKLQWWGSNNSAHYNWDGHKNTCNILHPEQGSHDPQPQGGSTTPTGGAGTTTQPSPEQIKKEAKENQGPIMQSVEWWDRSWIQALHLARERCKCAADTVDCRICACGIMHDFATLELARVFKKVLEAEKK